MGELVASSRIELEYQVPETCVLSIVLRGQFFFQKSSSWCRFKIFFSGNSFLFRVKPFKINQYEWNIGPG